MFTDDQSRRYAAATHAMQSGVAADQASGSADGSPKHLRVGVNSALVETSALARLLIDKGVFSQHEYAEAVIGSMEQEVSRYQALLSDKHNGARIELA